MIEETNSTCANCSKRFNDTNKEIIMFECGHIVHSTCLSKYNKIRCILCEYAKLVKFAQSPQMNIIRYDNNPKYRQKNIDVLSLRKTKWEPSIKNYINLFYRIPRILIIGSIFLLNYSIVMAGRYLEKMFNSSRYTREIIDKMESITHYNLFNGITRVLNIKIKWDGLENIASDEKKIFISNHTSYYDGLLIGTKIRCGALYSSSINNIFVKMLSNLTPSIKIDRGKKNNVVKKINNFMENNSSIFICPQGIFSHINTISKFRTGAFATNYNVQPIILKYKQDISSLRMFDMLLFDMVEVDIIVMRPIEKNDMNPRAYADFTLDKMIEKSKLLKSNVTSYDVRD